MPTESFVSGVYEFVRLASCSTTWRRGLYKSPKDPSEAIAVRADEHYRDG